MRTTAAILIAIAAVSATAQNVGTEELLRQQERERQQRIQQEKTPDVRLQPPAAREASLIQNKTPCFVIQHIDLTGELADRFRFALATVVEGVGIILAFFINRRSIDGEEFFSKYFL